MEILAACLALLAAMLLAAVMLRPLFQSKTDENLPPGSLGWPLIGETLSLLGSFRNDFYTSRIAKYGPDFKTSLFGSKTVVLSGPQGNRFIFMSENKFLKASYPESVYTLLGPKALISLSGEEHRRVRSILMTFLRPEMLQKFVSRVSKVAQEHLDTFWRNKAGDVVLVYFLMKKFTLALACDLLVGLGLNAGELDPVAEELEHLATALLQLPIDLPGTKLHRGKIARKRLDQQLDRCIQRRREKITKDGGDCNEDMLGLLLTTTDADNGQFSDSEIKDNIINLLFAGHDTSSAVLTWVFKFLADNPSCMERTLQENMEIKDGYVSRGGELSWEDLRKMKYTWQVAQESMRVRPPVSAGYRVATSDIKYKDYVIPKGWKLSWSTSCYSKDEYFSEPLKFDPSRFERDDIAPYVYIPFGGGLRTCPGNEFAKMEMLVFLHLCIVNFSWILMQPEEEIIAAPIPRPKNGLPVKVFVRGEA